jgi:hypothetical protein
MLKPNFEGFPIPSRTIPKVSRQKSTTQQRKGDFTAASDLEPSFAIASHVCRGPSHDGHEHGVCSALRGCSYLV